jgi:WG containing repeat
MLLIRRIILVFSVLLAPYLSKAQFVSERSAINNLGKGKWEKAKSQLSKILSQDSIHAGAEYVLSRYFFSKENPDFHIDSAYTHIQRALYDYQHTTLKEREKLVKLPVDSLIITNYRKRIDSAAFARARQTNTEVAYLDFLKRFSSADQKKEAIALRDEVAYSTALTENTYDAFLRYLGKYPESAFASEARDQYERLLFESKTQDQKLATFESFLLQYPETPYRKEVEKQIFEKITAGGDASSFDRFIRKYPASSRVQQAKNILYHLLKEDERALMPTLMGDSIRKVQALERHYLVPFLKDDKFGFMDERGTEFIKPTLKEISEDYLCGNVTDELLMADGKIMTRTGAVIYRGKTDEIEQLGYGFLLIDDGSCSKVLHVSGFTPDPSACLQDAKLLARNYLALKKHSHWSVWTLTGRLLIPYEWDDIQLLGEVVAFKKGSKLRLVKLKDLAKIVEQQSPTFSKEYDEVKLWNDGMLWVRHGSDQAVLNQSLNEWIKSGRQQITPAFFGAVGQSAAGYALYDKSGASQSYYQVKIQKPWIVVQQEGAWHRIDLAAKKVDKDSYDSVSFAGPFLLAMKKDSLQIHLTGTARIDLPKVVKTHFIPGKDSLFFVMLEDGDKKTVFNTKAKKLFTLVADKLEYNNENYFTITVKQRKGLVSMAGKIVLPAEYDGVGTVTAGVVATLKDKKFGLIDLIHKKSVKPEYDKNITTYDKSRLIAFRGNVSALIGWDNKPITPFEFEEIWYWNDSSILVKKNFQWIIYDFVEKRILIDKIKAFKWVSESAAEKIMIVQQENKYGVLSNTRGMIIPATFSDIVNVGSSTEPLYFTEKHVEEASIFVVIYYDRNGVQLRKHVYEGDDYEKIYCSGK